MLQEEIMTIEAQPTPLTPKGNTEPAPNPEGEHRTSISLFDSLLNSKMLRLHFLLKEKKHQFA